MSVFETLANQLFAIHDALTAARLPHAFGGAIALAYCVEEPRGTRDLDVNVFTDSSNSEMVLSALPSEVTVKQGDAQKASRDGQVRVWWGTTPIDLFLNNVPFHERVAQGVIHVPLGDREIPVLNCMSLVVFKAMFNRGKDWVDIDAVAEVDNRSIESACETVEQMIGTDDERFTKLAAIAADPGAYRRPGRR